MRISDWSSDVCSSDLFERIANGHLALNRIEVKMQSPGHAIVHHKGLSIRPVAQGLQDLRYVGTRLRSQAQDALLRHELRRNFDPVLLAPAAHRCVACELAHG